MEKGYSVIIRTKNSESSLQACLNSVLRQTLIPKKILVVDAGSVDKTIEIAKGYNTEIIHYPSNLEFNYSKALNIGISRIMTEKILILSAHVEFIDISNVFKMNAILDLNEDCVAVSTLRTSQKRNCFSENGEKTIEEEISIENFTGRAMYNFCSLIQRISWEKYPFNENIPRCEDQEWISFYLKKGYHSRVISCPLVYYNNPYYNSTKDAWDYIILGENVYPYFLSNKFLKDFFFKSLSHFRNGETELFLFNIRILTKILKHKFLSKEDIKSVYNKRQT